ncbi:hypothetical protein QUB63_16680 [Microcoleus sp. ARI1-B5]
MVIGNWSYQVWLHRPGYSGGAADRDEEARSIAFLGRDFSKVLNWAIAQFTANIHLKSTNPQKHQPTCGKVLCRLLCVKAIFCKFS